MFGILCVYNAQSLSLVEVTPPVCDACPAILHTMSSGKYYYRGRAIITMSCGRIGNDRAGCSGLAAEGNIVVKRIASHGLRTPSSLAHMGSLSFSPILQR